MIQSRLKSGSTFSSLRPPAGLCRLHLAPLLYCVSHSAGQNNIQSTAWAGQRLRNSVVWALLHKYRYFYNHEAVREWHLAVGRHTKSMWVWGVITLCSCLLHLLDTTALQGIGIGERFNKSLVRFTEILLTPDYTFYKSFQLLRDLSRFYRLVWHILTKCKRL